MRYTPRWIVLTSFFLVAAETPLPGQRVTGTITGRVTDNTGAVLPGANIIILNTLTQEERRTVTDETGSYGVPSLPPGTYTVAAEVSGFKKGLRQNLVLRVADEARVDITLQVGEITETVSITDLELGPGQAPDVHRGGHHPLALPSFQPVRRAWKLDVYSSFQRQ